MIKATVTTNWDQQAFEGLGMAYVPKVRVDIGVQELLGVAPQHGDDVATCFTYSLPTTADVMLTQEQFDAISADANYPIVSAEEV